MKKLTIILAFLTLPLGVFAQDSAISTFFSKYSDDEEFTTVYISKRMFQMFANMADEEDAEVKETISNIGGLQILSRDSIDGLALYQEANKLLSSNYEELMIVREKTSKTRFLIKENSKGQITELLMITGSTESFTIISFIGIINLEQMSKLSSNLEIEGMEHLDNLEKQKE